MKDPHDTVTIEIERTRPTQEQMLKAMAEVADEQRRMMQEQAMKPEEIKAFTEMPVQAIELSIEGQNKLAELLSDEDREFLDMPPIGAEFGASEDD